MRMLISVDLQYIIGCTFESASNVSCSFALDGLEEFGSSNQASHVFAIY